MNPIGSGIELELVPVPCAMCGSTETEPRPVFEGYDYEYRTCDNRFRFVACADCGHVYLSPRVRMEDIDRIYPTNYLQRHLECIYPEYRPLRWIKQNVFDRGWLREVLNHLQEGTRVLEIGAGSGNQLEYLRSNTPYSVELYANDLTFSKQTRASLSACNIKLLEGPIEECEDVGKFNVIISKHVIEHVIDPAVVFRWISAHLVPKGMLYLETPDLNALTRFVFGNHWYALSIPRHFHLFSRKALAELAERSGLDIDSQHAVVDANVWIKSFRNRWGRKPVDQSTSTASVDGEPKQAIRFFSLFDLFLRTLGFAGSVQALIARKPEGGG